MEILLRVVACLAGGLIAAMSTGVRLGLGQEPRAVPGRLLHYLPVTDERLLAPEPEHWLMYRRTYDGMGYSPLSQIDTANVVDLAPAWMFHTGTNDGKPQSPPIVNGETMFVTTAEQVIALDASTGALRWRYVHPLPADVRRPHSTNRGVALYDEMVYVGTLDARVVALRATTGEVVWNRAIANYYPVSEVRESPGQQNWPVNVGRNAPYRNLS